MTTLASAPPMHDLPHCAGGFAKSLPAKNSDNFP